MDFENLVSAQSTQSDLENSAFPNNFRHFFS